MQKVLYLRHCLFVLRRTAAAFAGMHKGMRFGFVEENESAKFVSVLTGIWHVVREMTFWSEAVTTHVLPATLSMKLSVDYCNKFMILAVLCMQILWCRLLLSAEKSAESTQEIKISRPFGRIFIKPSPIPPSTLGPCLL